VRQPSTPPLRTDRVRWGSVRGQTDGDAQPHPMSPAELFVAQMVADLDLGDSSSATRKRRVLQRFVDWSVAEEIPLDRDSFSTRMPWSVSLRWGLATDQSCATYRSILRRIGPLLTKRAPWQPQSVTVARRALAPPYTEQEVALLVADGKGQPTDERRRAARALLALGLGSGLDGRWITRVSAADPEGHCGARLHRPFWVVSRPFAFEVRSLDALVAPGIALDRSTFLRYQCSVRSPAFGTDRFGQKTPPRGSSVGFREHKGCSFMNSSSWRWRESNPRPLASQ
jgi:hypothetical protein